MELFLHTKLLFRGFAHTDAKSAHRRKVLNLVWPSSSNITRLSQIWSVHKANRHKGYPPRPARLQLLFLPSNMAGLDVDSVLRRIGQFGPYQIRILALFTFIFFPITYQTLIMVFVAYEPPWMCAKHSVTCLESNNSSPNSSSVESAVYSTSTKPKQLYERRCSLKRSDWKFAEYDLYEGPHETIVTEVKTRFVVTMKLML